MRYLLNLLYLILLTAAIPWLIMAAVRKGKYREGWASKLGGWVPDVAHASRVRLAHPADRSFQPPVDAKRLWFHAVSVGEVNLLRPLVERISQDRPHWHCVVSTTTKTGYDLAQRLFPDLPVFYCPLDFSWAVDRAMRRIRPDLLVLAELELWPNLIAAAKRHGARVAVVNGRLSERSARGYARVRWFVRRVVRQIDLIAAQNDEYAERFRQLGAPRDRVVPTGSLKFDGARTDRRNEFTRRLIELAGIAESDIVFLAGSTQDPEEQMALEVFRQLRDAYPELRLILVPRHPERFAEVAQLLDRSGLAWQRRSQLHVAHASRMYSDPRILLVDQIGELGAWWGAAHIGFVGGSMGSRGGQNMIEPAAYGVAVSFGPNTRNFRDIVAMMLDARSAVVVQDRDEMETFARRCLDDESYRNALGERARMLVARQLGATQRTLQHLDLLLQSKPSDQRQHAA